MIVSTLKKSTKKPSNKPIRIGIKRMTSSQLINPKITHSISPNHTKNHDSSSVSKKYTFAKQIKIQTKGNHKFQHHPRSINTSNNTSSMNHLPSDTPQSQNTIQSTPAVNNNNENQSKTNSTNNYIINTLNVSTKNVISNNSMDYSEPVDYALKLKKIQKENEELKTKSKEQAKRIETFQKKTKSLEKVLYDSLEFNKKLKKKYNESKEKENQLLAMLYVIDQRGVPVDDIIDKYNKENQSIRETNRSFDSAMYTPITLEHSTQPQPLTNIPKLNFSRINQSYQMNISQGEDNTLNHSQIVFNYNKKKSSNDKKYAKDENDRNKYLKN